MSSVYKIVDYLVENEYMVIADYLVVSGDMVSFGLKIASLQVQAKTTIQGHASRRNDSWLSGGIWEKKVQKRRANQSHARGGVSRRLV